MTSTYTRFYLDKVNGKVFGVCSGIADYTGVDVTVIRIGMIVMHFMTGFSTVPLYILAAIIAPTKPVGLYSDKEDQKFWQGVRQSPKRVTRDVRSRFRDVDRRLADIEHMYTARNRQLSDEIESLR
jgi:phage shock protein C